MLAETWKGLVEPIDFFKEHETFLEVTVIADTNTKFGFWGGYCNSRIRMLSQILEEELKNKIKVTLNPTEYNPNQEWINQHKLVSDSSKSTFGPAGEDIINLAASDSEEEGDEEEEEEESSEGAENGPTPPVTPLVPKKTTRQQQEPTLPEKPTAGVHYIGLDWVDSFNHSNVSLDGAVARFRAILKASREGMYGPIIRIVDAANIPAWVYNDPPDFEGADLSTPAPVRDGAFSPDPSVKPSSPVPPAAGSMKRSNMVTPPPAVAMKRPGSATADAVPPAAAPMKRPVPAPEAEAVKRPKED